MTLNPSKPNPLPMHENTPCLDPIVEDVVAMLRRRSMAGKAKYGVTLHESQQSFDEFLVHLQEELLDAANYVQKLRDLHSRLRSDTAASTLIGLLFSSK